MADDGPLRLPPGEFVHPFPIRPPAECSTDIGPNWTELDVSQPIDRGVLP